MKIPIAIITLLFWQQTFATVWQVGPTRTYTYCSQVAPLVQNGDTIQIDFATYINDSQVQWNKNNLLIIGVGGRPKLQAGNIIANDLVNGKGIFVVSGANVRIENIEFTNAVVVSNNGAGIRQEGVNLFVTHCKFDGNEMGILQGGTIANCKTTIEYSEFLNGGSTANPGYQHNIYINHIDTLIFRYNFTYNAIAQGHELKSRATYNFILYNTISNYQTVDSRNIDLPNGGTTVIMGNIIEQGIYSANSNILGYGLEGLSNSAPHELWIVNNTFVNKKSTGSFIHIASGTNKLFLKNNILAGAKTGGLIIGTATILDSLNNIINDNISNCGFVNTTNNDYHLLNNSVAVDAGFAIATNAGGYQLYPDKMYKDTCDFESRTLLNAIDVGAFEYNLPLSVTEFSTKQAFSVFPNPATNFITINLQKAKDVQTFQIYNSFAAIVKEVSISNSGETINLNELPSGLYFIRLKSISSQTLNFIKQ